MKPARKRALVEYVQAAYDVSERRGCTVLMFARSSQRYESVREPCTELRMRIKELAAARVTVAFVKLRTMPKRFSPGRLSPAAEAEGRSPGAEAAGASSRLTRPRSSSPPAR